MAPLTPELAPRAQHSVELAREAERDQLIDPLSNMSRQRIYVFTGSCDTVGATRWAIAGLLHYGTPSAWAPFRAYG